jgi:threonine/homoserine/homoserine lactone efflux protein
MLDSVSLSLLTFAAAAGLLTLTPGVDTAIVLRSAASLGQRAGAAAAAGVCAGLFIWGAGAALGLGALLAASAKAYLALKWVGAAYLVYLGVKLIAKPRSAPPTAGAPPISDARDPARSALWRGFLTNVLNPKVGVFYATFLPQFIPNGVNVVAFSALLTAVHVALTALWFALLVVLTAPLGRWLRRPATMRALDRLTGCVFIGFGVKLAVADRA